MKVNPFSQLNQAQSLATRNPATPAKTPAETTVKGDNLTLTRATQDAFSARTDKVAQLTKLVNAKDYSPDPVQISQKLVSGALTRQD